jgi:hypothetical protein
MVDWLSINIFSGDRRVGSLLASVNHAFKHFNVVASLENLVPLMAGSMFLLTPGPFLRPGA